MTCTPLVRAALLAATLVGLSPSTARATASSLVATAVSTSGIDLRWVGATKGRASYGVERSTSAASGFIRIAAVDRAVSYQDRGLAAGVTYYYRIRDLRDGGLSNVASATTFAPANVPPVANAGPDQFAQVAVSVTFDGRGSLDPDGTIRSWAWQFGDGTTAAGSMVTHTYAASGSYAARLTVTDDRGMTASDTAAVSVLGAATTTTTAPPTTTATSTSTTTTLPPTSGEPAAVGTFQWMRRFGSLANDRANALAVDGAGNVAITGITYLPVDFGNGFPCEGFFVASYTPAGALRWVHCGGAATLDIGVADGRGIAIDANGDVAVAGLLNGSVDLGGGILVGGSDPFVAKYAGADGSHRWSHVFPGDAAVNGFSAAVAVTPSGYVAVTGTFHGHVDFGGGPLAAADSGFGDAFLAVFTPVGQHVWSRRFGGTGRDSGNAVAADASGNVVVTGRFEATADFGAGPRTTTQAAIFVAKYSTAGAHVWSRTYGGASLNDGGRGVAVDGSGNVLVTGMFGGPADFGGGLIGSTGTVGFLLKLTSAGTHVWSQAVGLGYAIAVDRWGNAIVSRGFGVDKYSPSGVLRWSRLWLRANVRGLGAGPDGAVTCAGTFQMSQDFGGGTVTSFGYDDAFFVRLTP